MIAAFKLGSVAFLWANELIFAADASWFGNLKLTKITKRNRWVQIWSQVRFKIFITFKYFSFFFFEISKLMFQTVVPWSLKICQFSINFFQLTYNFRFLLFWHKQLIMKLILKLTIKILIQLFNQTLEASLSNGEHSPGTR